MDAASWTVIGATIAVLATTVTAFRNLRDEMRLLNTRIDDQGKELRAHIDAQGAQLNQLSMRMVKLEGLLEGLREAMTGKRTA